MGYEVFLDGAIVGWVARATYVFLRRVWHRTQSEMRKHRPESVDNEADSQDQVVAGSLEHTAETH